MPKKLSVRPAGDARSARSSKPMRVPRDSDPEFWQLDLEEQIRQARVYTRHALTPALVELSVMDLADFYEPNQLLEHQIASLIHAGRALGRAEAEALAAASGRLR